MTPAEEDVMTTSTPEVVMIAMIVCFALSAGLYAFFRLRNGMVPAEA